MHAACTPLFYASTGIADLSFTETRRILEIILTDSSIISLVYPIKRMFYFVNQCILFIIYLISVNIESGNVLAENHY